MGSELRFQNLDLAKFQKIHRNPYYVGRFFLRILKKYMSGWPNSNSAQNFGQIPSQPLGLTIFLEVQLEEAGPRFEEILGR